MKELKHPKNFILDKENACKVIHYINNIYKRRLNPKIEIDCSDVEYINEADYILFKAIVEKIAVDHRIHNKEKRKKIEQLPSMKLIKTCDSAKHKLKKILGNTGRNNNNIIHFSLADYENMFPKSMINNLRVNPKTVHDIVNELRSIGIKEYYEEFYNYLIELIMNAVEHGIQNRHINWWMHKSIDYKTKTISYSCVDLGKGIIRSYTKAGIFNIWERFIVNKGRLLENAFKGKYGSSTKLVGRGHGLPTIDKMVTEQWVSDFVIITNNTYMWFDARDMLYKTKKTPNFAGTYYSWSINSENFERWKKSQ